MKYKQLTLVQRSEIKDLRDQGLSQKKIADYIKVSQSTVSRELQRNGKPRSYNPEYAQRQTDKRKQWRHRPRKYTPELKRKVHWYLRNEQWSPKQIIGHLKRFEICCVSHETIYADIRSDKAAGGDLHQNMRHKMKHRNRTLYRNKTPIPNRVDISLMPKEADGTRFGDFQMDLIIGANGKQAILTITEVLSNFGFIIRLPDGKDADGVANAVCKALLPYKGLVKTILTDNGPEFAAHEKIVKKLGVTVYFARPYHSWEKGSIENFNKLIRQYIPKKSDFNNFSNRQLLDIQKKLNRRPREKLNFDSPKNVFFNYLNLYALTT